MAIDRNGAPSDALKEVHTRLCQGYTEVVDADLSRYFDTIPHRELMQSVARRISDRHVFGPDQDVAEDPGGRGGWTRAAASDRWQAEQVRHTPRRGNQSAAGQPVHEPLLEILAADPDGREAGSQCGQLCG